MVTPSISPARVPATVSLSGTFRWNGLPFAWLIRRAVVAAVPDGASIFGFVMRLDDLGVIEVW